MGEVPETPREMQDETAQREPDDRRGNPGQMVGLVAMDAIASAISAPIPVGAIAMSDIYDHDAAMSRPRARQDRVPA